MISWLKQHIRLSGALSIAEDDPGGVGRAGEREPLSFCHIEFKVERPPIS